MRQIPWAKSPALAKTALGRGILSLIVTHCRVDWATRPGLLIFWVQQDMSIYGFFNCHDCRQTIWLGKALRNDVGDQPFAFQRGQRPKHWNQPHLNKIIWKFLADHTGHHIDVRLDHQMTEEIHSYQEIGGDTGNDIAEEQYLKTPSGWYESD